MRQQALCGPSQEKSADQPVTAKPGKARAPCTVGCQAASKETASVLAADRNAGGAHEILDQSGSLKSAFAEYESHWLGLRKQCLSCLAAEGADHSSCQFRRQPFNAPEI